MDLAMKKLVDELACRNLVTPFLLNTPIHLGAVDNPHVLTITHGVTLPIRHGDTFYQHTFGIADIPGPPHLIFGQPWLQKYCPKALRIIEQFGISQILSPETPNMAAGPYRYSPPLTPARTPPASPQLKPISAPPCKDPKLAFSAGGDFPLLAAIESEEYRRKEALDRHTTTLRIHLATEYILKERQTTVYTRAAAAQGANDPGVRGLTGNKEGWLDTIPSEYRHFADTIFSDDAANELPPYRPGSDCEIKLKEGEKLRQSKLYDMSTEELKQLKALLDLELQRGFIRPSDSSSSAPVFFVRDPSSGTRSGQLRLVVDYRDLNSKIKQDEYPIPLTRTVMNDLAKAQWITSMDVRSGFSNLRVAKGSEQATAFKTFYGLFEYTVMPMGLSTAPSIFQRFINSVLNPYLGIFCHAYLDDVVIYSSGTLEDHKSKVLKVLQALEKNGLRLKPHKCKWFRKQCNFLGYTIECGKGVRMADDKIQGIRDIDPPRGVSELRSFLGVVGFYDRFIPHYSDTTACLNDLLKKDAPWKWDPELHGAAFAKIVAAIRNDIFLRAFDPEKPIRLSTDSSDVAYAGAMEQEYEDGWHPFLLFHHKFKDGEKGWDGPDKELYAIVYAFSHYRHFLSQPKYPVQVFTDHRNLAKFMFSSNLLKSHDGRLGRWWETLSQANFVIQYLPGKENILPDFLSRYGFEAAADLKPRILLPEQRFSAKALADIRSWFKKSETTPNIRHLLEKKFATTAQCKNQNSSPDPVPDPHLLSLDPASLNSREKRLSRKLLKGYGGNPLLLPSTNDRLPRDKRGLGYATDAPETQRPSILEPCPTFTPLLLN
jgi:hypothetical protein